MGLDVYLNKKAKNWTMDEYRKEREADKEESVTDDDISIELASKKHPEEHFKVGYFRSSYNGSGTNQVLGKAGVMTLNEIFDVKGDEYLQFPDWDASLVRAKKALADLQDAAKNKNYGVQEMKYEFIASPRAAAPVNDELEALNSFMEEVKQHTPKEGEKDSGFRDYSCSKGEFHLDGEKVFGFIHGMKKHFLSGRPEPCLYIVTQGYLEHYVPSLEIVVETIEYVLAQPDREKFYMRWSG
jgi:hypothetical protein